MSHEMFWRQMLRWLVSDTPTRVVTSTPGRCCTTTAACSCAPKFATPLICRPAMRRWRRASWVRTAARRSVELHPDPLEQGVYTADWDAGQAGSYVAEITATRGQQELGRDVVTFRREDGVAENFHLEQNRELLEKLSSQTGGRYYQPERSEPNWARTFPIPKPASRCAKPGICGTCRSCSSWCLLLCCTRMAAAPKMGCSMKHSVLFWLLCSLRPALCTPPRSTSPSPASAANPSTSSASHLRPRRSTNCCTPPARMPR